MFTSIRNSQHNTSYYQINYIGSKTSAIKDFCKDAEKDGSTWGHLINPTTGDVVYSLDQKTNIDIDAITDKVHKICKANSFFKLKLYNDFINIMHPTNGAIGNVKITWGPILAHILQTTRSEDELSREIHAIISKWIETHTIEQAHERRWGIRLFNECSNMGIVTTNVTFPEAKIQFAAMASYHIQEGHNFGMCFDTDGIEFGHLFCDGVK